MIKYILLPILFGTFTYLGFQISYTYMKKQIFYEDLLDFCSRIKNEISFLKTDVLTIYKESKYKSDLSQIIIEIEDAIEKGEYLDENVIRIILNRHVLLNEEDKVIMTKLFYEVGKIGYEEQIVRIDYYIKSIGLILSNYKEKSGKMVPLFRKMGFLVGLLICIVLI